MTAAGDGQSLKRTIGFWGSFSMGYADIGANIYVALGLIALYAAQAAPLAFGVAAISYLFTGLAYAELASVYPIAGGAQLYASRALRPIFGFIAGWGLLLDYTICILLFALLSVGYMSSLGAVVPAASGLALNPYLTLATIVLIGTLAVLNFRGLVWSSRVNVGFVLVDLATLFVIMALGLPHAFLSGGVERWLASLARLDFAANLQGFTYATTLALVSYIGIESISQAAEETKNPGGVIPRATKAVIVLVIVVALALSFLSVTLIEPTPGFWLAHAQSPVVAVVDRLPVLGPPLALWVGIVGATIAYVSANSCVIGASRVAFAMGRQGLLPRAFSRLHRKYRTPYVTLLVFSAAAVALILLNIQLPAADLITLIASLYNFGALAAYSLVHVSLIILRHKDRGLARPWRAPWNFRVGRVEIPLTGVLGFGMTTGLWVLLVLTHGQMPRLLAGLWFAIGLAIYLTVRRKRA